MPGMIKQRAVVAVTLNGAPIPGLWDTKTGSETTSAITKHRPGGSLIESPLGGLPSANDETLERVFDVTRDLALLPGLHAAVGTGVVDASWQAVDDSMLPIGTPRVRHGVLMGVKDPDYDSTSPDKALIQIVLSLASG